MTITIPIPKIKSWSKLITEILLLGAIVTTIGSAIAEFAHYPMPFTK